MRSHTRAYCCVDIVLKVWLFAQIIAIVKAAPVRRLDNLITRLYDNARLLKMHAVVMEAVRKDYTSLQV